MESSPALRTEPVHELLSPVEARLLTLAKAEAERLQAEAQRVLNDSLGLIIRAHGHDQDDARYDFVQEGVDIRLKISPKLLP